VKFLVPKATDEADAERLYAAMAELCGVPAPEASERIQSITYEHNGEEWIAEVGQPLRGTRTDRRRRKDGTVDITTRLSDPAVVLAIFAGNPHQVVNDARPVGAVISAWENPFFVGETSVRRGRRFDASPTEINGTAAD
jgi:hypothetical protein